MLIIKLKITEEPQFESVRLRTLRVCYATAHSQIVNPSLILG